MKLFLKLLFDSAFTLARSTDKNPLLTTCVVMVFFLFFNLLEAMIETLIWGDRFEHWLDPIFICAFIGYAGLTVHCCAELRRKERKERHDADVFRAQPRVLR